MFTLVTKKVLTTSFFWKFFCCWKDKECENPLLTDAPWPTIQQNCILLNWTMVNGILWTFMSNTCTLHYALKNTSDLTRKIVLNTTMEFWYSGISKPLQNTVTDTVSIIFTIRTLTVFMYPDSLVLMPEKPFLTRPFPNVWTPILTKKSGRLTLFVDFFRLYSWSLQCLSTWLYLNWRTYMGKLCSPMYSPSSLLLYY